MMTSSTPLMTQHIKKRMRRTPIHLCLRDANKIITMHNQEKIQSTGRQHAQSGTAVNAEFNYQSQHFGQADKHATSADNDLLADHSYRSTTKPVVTSTPHLTLLRYHNRRISILHWIANAPSVNNADGLSYTVFHALAAVFDGMKVHPSTLNSCEDTTGRSWKNAPYIHQSPCKPKNLSSSTKYKQAYILTNHQRRSRRS